MVWYTSAQKRLYKSFFGMGRLVHVWYFDDFEKLLMVPFEMTLLFCFQLQILFSWHVAVNVYITTHWVKCQTRHDSFDLAYYFIRLHSLASFQNERRLLHQNRPKMCTSYLLQHKKVDINCSLLSGSLFWFLIILILWQSNAGSFWNDTFFFDVDWTE